MVNYSCPAAFLLRLQSEQPQCTAELGAALKWGSDGRRAEWQQTAPRRAFRVGEFTGAAQSAQHSPAPCWFCPTSLCTVGWCLHFAMQNNTV